MLCLSNWQKIYADVTPFPKNDDKNDKANYRQIIFPNISVNFGKILMRNIASKRFQKNGIKPLMKVAKHGQSQNIFLRHLIALITIYLQPKLMHRSLKKVVTKFNAYGLEKRSLGFIHPYLSKCKERTKVDSAFSS